MSLRFRNILFCACLSFSQLLAAGEQQQPDIVTLKNGNIFHGTVAREIFMLDTAFGHVTVPYSEMSLLVMEDKLQHIETRNGERLSGTLRQQTFAMLRLLDPTLPLEIGEISHIEFGQHPSPATRLSGQDFLELGNGDRLRGRVTSGELMVRNEAGGITLHGSGEITTADLARFDEESPQVLLRFNGNEKIVRGELLNKAIEMESLYGQSLSIPSVLIERLSFNRFPPEINQRADLTRAGQHAFQPLQAFRDRLVDGHPGPEMITLEGGRFQRGDLQGDGDFDEQPATPVTLAQRFAIALHEVTFAEYDRFCESTRRQKPSDEGWGRGQRPVININWEDAVAYTRWLSTQTRRHYRLPTDAEWEYAARGGTASRYWWGNEPGLARANCTGCGSLWDGEQSAPVGRFPPNPFGLYDISGNVWEWVADCFHDRFAEAPADGSAVKKEGCGKRVIRGGAWSFPVKEMRSANRWRDFPSRSSDDTGFRVVREIQE
jgi:formylglycine-generating enzyme required for sulfatase activity